MVLSLVKYLNSLSPAGGALPSNLPSCSRLNSERSNGLPDTLEGVPA